MYTQTDKNLRAAVFEALEAEPRIDAGRIGIALEDGVVTLTGTLGSFTEKWAAENAVKTVKGVRGIANELRVDLPAMHAHDDTDIAQTIVDMIRWSNETAQEIQVEVQKGSVTLRGTVEWPYQRRDLLDIVRHISGVRAIHDEIRVLPHPIDPVSLRHKIASRFQRLAALAAKNVAVEAAPDGIVTLSGTVSSLAERDEAESAAYSVPGTTEVRNDLWIEEDV